MAVEGSKALPKFSTQLGKTLSHRNFDAEKFAKSISAQSDGDKDLQESKQRVQVLGEDTALILKKQVYHNYQQFIDTAKEISYLEGEMFQLNNILTEQKNLMESMTSMFVTKAIDEVIKDESKKQIEDKEQEQRKVMAQLIGKVEGCSNIVEAPGRYLVHDGDVIELDMDSFAQIGKHHLFLFNDCVMVTTWTAGARRGNAASGKYRYQDLWEIDTLGVVNARDVGQKEGYFGKNDEPAVKNAFKVLVFPNSRMFQCENAKEKREWLEIMDETKRDHLSEKEKKERAVSSPTSPVSPLNPFAEMEESPKHSDKPEPTVASRDERLLVGWLQEMPEDLDVYIAQRYFEQAVEVIHKTKNYLANINDSPLKSDIETKLNNRTQQLIEVLSRELKSSPDRSLRGGPRIVTKPVILLIKLQETAKACSLFLDNRSSAVRFAIRQLRTEGSLPLYIGKLCKVFFSHLEETGREFNEAFQDIPGCYSSFVIWARKELMFFVDTFSHQVFGKSADITEIAECVQNAQAHCVKLLGLGLDLDFQLNNLLVGSIESTLKDHKQKIIDATKLRNSEETWRPTNMGTPQAMEKLLDEMQHFGIKNFVDYCYDGCFARLTAGTLSFTRAIINHVDSSVKMLLPELEQSILSGIVEIMTSFTEFTAGCVRCETGRHAKATLIRENANFVAKSLMPLLESKIQKKIHQSPKQLLLLRAEFSKSIGG